MAPVAPERSRPEQGGATDEAMSEELRRLAALSCLKDDSMPPAGLLPKLRSGVACFYPELPWGSPPAWKESGHPTTAWLVTWELVTCLAVVWVGASLPYAAFIDGAKHNNHQFLGGCAIYKWGMWPPSSASVWAGVDLLCDFLFFLDLSINFVTARWVIITQGREEWGLVSDLAEVRRLYMWTVRPGQVLPVPQFWTDLLGVFPWQYADCVTEDASSIKMFRVFRFIKLTRLARLTQLLEQWRQAYPSSRFFISFAQLFFVIIGVAHWMCCVWFWVGYVKEGWVARTGLAVVQDDTALTGPGSSLIPVSFFDGDEGRGPDGLQGHVYEWVTSIYWAITTMTTIGYGDISAYTGYEKIFSSFVMMLGCCFFAWSTGVITSLITDRPYCVSRFNDTMDELNEFIESRKLPGTLNTQLKSFYMLKFPTMRIYDEESVLEGLPKGLARAVRIELFKDVLELSPFFFGMNVATDVKSSSDSSTLENTSVAGDICARLSTLYKTVGLSLTHAGDVPDAMYVVRTGVVGMQLHGHEIAIARPGDVVGEMALLGLAQDGRRIRTSVCHTMCELCVITKEMLEELLHIEGFRLPLRRMLATYVDGLAGTVTRRVVPQSDEGATLLTNESRMRSYRVLYDFNNIPWQDIAQRLRSTDSHHAALHEEFCSGGKQPFREAASFRATREMSTPTMIKAAEIKRFSGSMSGGMSMAMRKMRLSITRKVLKTRLTISLRSFYTDNKEFNGKQRIVVAAAWASKEQMQSGKTVVLDTARSFSKPININFENGRGQIVGGMSHLGSLTLDLIHPEGRNWSDMDDIKIVLYRVVGHFSPPLPEDTFQRLDTTEGGMGTTEGGSDSGSSSEWCTTEQMAAEEMLVGLRILQSGRVPVAKVIENRSQPVFLRRDVSPSKLSFSNDADEDQVLESLAAANSMSAFEKIVLTQCSLEQHESDSVAPGGSITHLDFTSDAYRVLPADSRWFKCLKTLGSSVSDSDYFHELKMRRLQKVRGVVWDLFQTAEAGSKNLETNQLLSDSKVLSMRMDRMEAKLEQLDQSLSRQLTRLTSLITNSAGVTSETDAAQTSRIGRSCGPERMTRGLEKYRRYMRDSIVKVSAINALAGSTSRPQETNGQSRAPQAASYNPTAAEAALPTPAPPQPSETHPEGAFPDLPGRTQASLVSD